MTFTIVQRIPNCAGGDLKDPATLERRECQSINEIWEMDFVKRWIWPPGEREKCDYFLPYLLGFEKQLWNYPVEYAGVPSLIRVFAVWQEKTDKVFKQWSATIRDISVFDELDIPEYTPVIK